MATDKIYNVEPREEGYAVIADGGKKASALTRTQAEGIAEARRLNPNAKPNVARVERTQGGGPDRYRKNKD
jgi:hypothetical protein